MKWYWNWDLYVFVAQEPGDILALTRTDETTGETVEEWYGPFESLGDCCNAVLERLRVENQQRINRVADQYAFQSRFKNGRPNA